MYINYDLYEEIKLYAQRHFESSKETYAKRNQNTSKIFQDCIRGKVAEFCCYHSMKDQGYILESPPDLQIYSGHNKSYAADLICIGKDNLLYENPRHIHVKSISRETYDKYGASILIEKNDPLVYKPDEHHFLSIMLQDSLTAYSFFKWINSVDADWKDPILNLPTKKALYF